MSPILDALFEPAEGGGGPEQGRHPRTVARRAPRLLQGYRVNARAGTTKSPSKLQPWRSVLKPPHWPTTSAPAGANGTSSTI
jgi:hypothetical protein